MRGACCGVQPNCIKPQIAIRAETTTAAHDTFIDTLYGPIATVHRLAASRRARQPLGQKSRPKLLHKTSTFYSLLPASSAITACLTRINAPTRRVLS